MDKKLRNLKTQFEFEIPTSFSEKDKQAVFQKIKEEKHAVKKDNFPFFPKPLIIGAIAILFFMFGGIASYEYGLFGSGSDSSANGNQEPNGNEGDLVPIALDQEQKRKVNENQDNDLIFDPETIQVGAEVGNYIVSNVEELDGERRITFEVKLLLKGIVKMDSYELLTLHPDEESRNLLPLTGEEQEDFSLYFLQNEKMNLEFELEPMESEPAEFQVNGLVYTWGKGEPSIGIQVMMVNPTSLRDKYPSKRYDTTIELSTELQSIYKEYAKKKNDMLLRGLKPIDIFKMYYHAMNLGDLETEYEFYHKGKNSGTPDRETYFNDPFFNVSEKELENAKDFYKQLETVQTFYEVYLSNDETVISFKIEPDSFNTFGFRLIKDSNTEVWKVSFIPLQ
jgi:hypothetical protein